MTRLVEPFQPQRARRDRACPSPASAGWRSTAPTIAARTRSPSWPTNGLMMLGCRISRTVSPARPAANAAQTCGPTTTGKNDSRRDGLSFAIDRAGAADELPAYDIARNCNEETAGVAVEGSASCRKDETDAKDQLAKRWSTYGASAKKFCVGESSTGGEKSYVELLTCLEMATDELGRAQRQ
jgi:hypothetical protein